MSKEDASAAEKLVKCSVISCPNFFRPDSKPADAKIRFFDFPSDDPATTKIWREKCGVAANYRIQGAKVCSEHFKASDYLTESKLKPSAIPRENLSWMFGEPEVKIVAPPKPLDFASIKEAVDANEMLVAKLEKLEKEEKELGEKLRFYERKNVTSRGEIERIKRLIGKCGVKRSGGKVEADLIRKVFSQAQINMLQGKKVVWSYDDMAMGFTLRQMGSRQCYLYLKDTLNMPLPSLSCVQRWVASNKP